MAERLPRFSPAATILAEAAHDLGLADGWSGPWSGRRGFDSLVQMSSGIAKEGMGWKGAARPVLEIEQTPWGAARRMRSPVVVGEVAFGWDRPASDIGSAQAQWL